MVESALFRIANVYYVENRSFGVSIGCVCLRVCLAALVKPTRMHRTTPSTEIYPHHTCSMEWASFPDPRESVVRTRILPFQMYCTADLNSSHPVTHRLYRSPERRGFWSLPRAPSGLCNGICSNDTKLQPSLLRKCRPLVTASILLQRRTYR
jgi:hypothetical protein